MNKAIDEFFHNSVTAKIDLFREERAGIPEVIFCLNKSVKQLIEIIDNVSSRSDKPWLFTRMTEEHIKYFIQNPNKDLKINLEGKTAYLNFVDNKVAKQGNILVLTAGTSDISVAKETEDTLRFLGYSPQGIYDVGVSALHRLLSYTTELKNAEVVIAIAGMEGALATVAASLIKAPLIAVPTSTGYGASMNGMTTLYSMVSSCVPGITVVNIDNGFGAACAASKILGIKYDR